jgi:hypothetical protein
MKGELNSPRLLKKSDSFFFEKERRKASDAKGPDSTSLRLSVPSIQPFFLVHESEGTFLYVLITGVGWNQTHLGPVHKDVTPTFEFSRQGSPGSKTQSQTRHIWTRAIEVGTRQWANRNAVETMRSRQKCRCRGQYSSVYHATNGFHVMSTATADQGQKSTYLDKPGNRLLQMCTACFSYGVLPPSYCRF